MERNPGLSLSCGLHPANAPSKDAERGQGLVEFALIFPLMLLILAAIVDMGLLYLTSQTVKHASREGARMAVKLIDLEANDSRVIAQVEGLIPNTGLYSGFNGGTTNTGIPSCSGSEQVTVTVAGTYNFVALNVLGFESLSLSFPTTMRYELCE